MSEKWKDYFKEYWWQALAAIVLFSILIAIAFSPSPVCHKSHQALFTAPRGESGAFDKDGKAIPLPPFKLVIQVCDDQG